jgi:integrase
MASLMRDGGGWRIMWYDQDQDRKTLRLGAMDKRTAQTVKVRVEAIVAAKLAGTPIDPETAAWLGKIGDKLHSRLAKVGLVPPRGEAQTVAGLIDEFLEEARKRGLKASTITASGVGCGTLRQFLGDRPVQDVTRDDAQRYRDWLLERGHSPSTVARRLQHARHVFGHAVDRELIARNPFTKVSPPAQNVAARRRYVTIDETRKLLDVAPNHHWRLLIALGRFAGLRIPSEAFALQWGHVHWDADRIEVPSPKTERVGKPFRFVPIFRLLRPFLEEAFDLAKEGDVYLFPEAWRQRALGKAGMINCNLQTQMLRLMARAGLDPWPRPLHNLRASCESDLANAFTLATVARWLGNTPSVALRHYVDPTDEAFRRAAQWSPDEGGAGGAKSDALAVQNPHPQDSANKR